MTFREWLDFNFYPDFDPSGLSDEEFYEMEEDYQNEMNLMDEEDEEWNS